MIETTTADPIPELEALGDLPHLHARVKTGLVWLRAHNGDADAFETGRRRLLDIAEREYLPALVRLVDERTPEQLRADQGEIEQRLNAGWGRQGAAADERWLQLLEVQEILADAVGFGGYLLWLDERIAAIRKPDAATTALIGGTHAGGGDGA